MCESIAPSTKSWLLLLLIGHLAHQLQGMVEPFNNTKLCGPEPSVTLSPQTQGLSSNVGASGLTHQPAVP